MKNKTINKRKLPVLIALMGLSTMAFVLLPRTSNDVSAVAEENTVSSQSNYDVDEQKHEAPAGHEPVFVSIFKFIVNCNPFKKETQL